ncbi:hypothetical protein DDE05_08440, partial [Streptomyces cavourensis]
MCPGCTSSRSTTRRQRSKSTKISDCTGSRDRPYPPPSGCGRRRGRAWAGRSSTSHSVWWRCGCWARCCCSTRRGCAGGS